MLRVCVFSEHKSFTDGTTDGKTECQNSYFGSAEFDLNGGLNNVRNVPMHAQ